MSSPEDQFQSIENGLNSPRNSEGSSKGHPKNLSEAQLSPFSNESHQKASRSPEKPKSVSEEKSKDRAPKQNGHVRDKNNKRDDRHRRPHSHHRRNEPDRRDRDHRYSRDHHRDSHRYHNGSHHSRHSRDRHHRDYSPRRSRDSRDRHHYHRRDRSRSREDRRRRRSHHRSSRSRSSRRHHDHHRSSGRDRSRSRERGMKKHSKEFSKKSAITPHNTLAPGDFEAMEKNKNKVASESSIAVNMEQQQGLQNPVLMDELLKQKIFQITTKSQPSQEAEQNGKKPHNTSDAKQEKSSKPSILDRIKKAPAPINQEGSKVFVTSSHKNSNSGSNDKVPISERIQKKSG